MKGKLCFYIIGIFLMGFGVSAMIKAHLGIGSYDALFVALSQFIWTPGTWLFVINALFIFLNALLMRNRPDFLGIFPSFITGFSVDFSVYILLGNVNVTTLETQIGIFLIGNISLALGVALYVSPNWAKNPIDNLMFALRERFGLELGKGRIIGEVTAGSVAFVLGGPVLYGTVIAALLTGPLIQYFYNLIQKKRLS